MTYVYAIKKKSNIATNAQHYLQVLIIRKTTFTQILYGAGEKENKLLWQARKSDDFFQNDVLEDVIYYSWSVVALKTVTMTFLYYMAEQAAVCREKKLERLAKQHEEH